MMKKIITSITSMFVMSAFAVVPAFAHVVVHPSQVGEAAFQEFSMSVPTEKDTPTVGIKLLIPDGLNMVMPNVKAGWTIAVKKNGSGDDAKVTEIDWTGGSIPSGQRDDFLFQAQVPAKETTLQWKAYQTYQDGSVVSWDHAPSKNPEDDAAPPPYSTTKVINDLKNGMTVKQSEPAMENSEKKDTVPMQFSIIALALSAVAIGISLRKK